MAKKKKYTKRRNYLIQKAKAARAAAKMVPVVREKRARPDPNRPQPKYKYDGEGRLVYAPRSKKPKIVGRLGLPEPAERFRVGISNRAVYNKILEMEGDLVEVAKFYGIMMRTLKERIAKNKDMAELVMHYKDVERERIRQRLVAQAMDGDFKAIKMFLEKQYPEEFGPTPKEESPMELIVDELAVRIQRREQKAIEVIDAKEIK